MIYLQLDSKTIKRYTTEWHFYYHLFRLMRYKESLYVLDEG